MSVNTCDSVDIQDRFSLSSFTLTLTSDLLPSPLTAITPAGEHSWKWNINPSSDLKFYLEPVSQKALVKASRQ